MSEVEQIVTGIDWWLREEVRQSNAGRNRVLDAYIAARQNFAMESLNPSNVDAKKAEGHFARFRFLMGIIRANPNLLTNDDYVGGKVIHHTLIFVSGGFRKQCFLQSGSQEEYERLRFDSGRAATLPLLPAVDAIITGKTFSGTASNIAEVIEQSEQANNDILTAQRSLNAWFTDNPERTHDVLMDTDEPVQATLHMQQLGIGMAVSHIALSASLRDGLLNVPMLEPKSITDAALMDTSPFAV